MASSEPSVTGAGAPWPEMRGDARNTGFLDVPCDYGGDAPWSFRTGRGVFSTPVVGPDGVVYVGSADGFLYAIAPDGSLEWKVATDGVIDSAALLCGNALVFGSGDEWLYCVETDPRDATPGDRIRWRFRARPPDGEGQAVAWWEGNVVRGPGETVLAGNTAGHAYCIGLDGEEKWSLATGNAIWTAPAVAPDGSSVWGSLDMHVRCLEADGSTRWTAPTLGFVVSSPALSADGTVYVGSFDGCLYALDAKSGQRLWAFATSDNIYASPALVEEAGHLVAIVVASTDGCVYAVGPDGIEMWRYDTGAVVRSSPVVSRAPSGESGYVAYVGAADGCLYAINVATGARRWSFDTTSSDPHLSDRRSLNGSPALNSSGVLIASEDGSVWHVPYDYPLHVEDPRGSTSPTEPLGLDGVWLDVVTPGGVSTRGSVAVLGRTSVVVVRLTARRHGRTVDAVLSDVTVATEGDVTLRWRASGDGHHLFIRSDRPWPEGTTVELGVAGRWHEYGADPTESVPVEATVRFSTRPASGASTPQVLAGTMLRLWRLAVSLPSFAASVNQIGFDSYDWLIEALVTSLDPGSEDSGTVQAHVQGARRDAAGRLVPDPASPFNFEMAGRFDRDALHLAGAGVVLPFSFGEVPTDLFELSFSVDRDGVAVPGATMYAEVIAIDVPFYGPLLVEFTRLADHEGRMVTFGTFLVEPAGEGPRPLLRVPT